MKLFRFHRGGFKESIDTTIQVNSFKDVHRVLMDTYKNANITQIRIQRDCIYDDRLPEDWNGIEFIVTGNLDNIGCALGYVNFYE